MRKQAEARYFLSLQTTENHRIDAFFASTSPKEADFARRVRRQAEGEEGGLLPQGGIDIQAIAIARKTLLPLASAEKLLNFRVLSEFAEAKQKNETPGGFPSEKGDSIDRGTEPKRKRTAQSGDAA